MMNPHHAHSIPGHHPNPHPAANQQHHPSAQMQMESQMLMQFQHQQMMNRKLILDFFFKTLYKNKDVKNPQKVYILRV